MNELCDLMLFEHSGPCADLKHREALARRAAGALKWGKLERRHEHGDIRDYVGGEPIHCGDQLELQAVRYEADDYGEFMLYKDEGIRVRYELSSARSPVLYANIGGHTFTSRLEAWMRVRVADPRHGMSVIAQDLELHTADEADAVSRAGEVDRFRRFFREL